MPIYLHEIIRVVPGREEAYMASVLSLQFIPGRKGSAGHHGQLGQFRAAETSGAWPKVVNIWQHDSWSNLTANLKRQFQDAERDTGMEEWWQANTALRHGGHDRVLLPAAYSPDKQGLASSGVQGRVFLHEIVKLPIGEAPAYLDRLGSDFLPAAAGRGWQLVGAYRVAWRPREVLTLWAMREWSQLGAVLRERETDPGLRDWFAYRDRLVRESEEMILLPGRMNPLGLR
jgi:hypothetical protein